MHSHEAVIVGTGFGGMGAAIQLKRLGIDDLVMLEREDDLGGTWHVNRYPGLAVDIASVTYSYSFEPNPWWKHWYARGPELKKYAEHVADKYDLRRHMRFNTVVEGARWDDDAQEWEVQVAGGEPVRATYLITATGFLSQPRLPDIEGVGDFAGAVVHSARWDPDVELDGQAGRDHRHRRHRGAADPRARQAGRPPHGLPAHADLGDPQAGPRDAAAGAASCSRGRRSPSAGRARSTPRCSS